MMYDHPVILTVRAIIAINEFLHACDPQPKGLRVSIQGGGCAGLQYSLDLCDDINVDFDFDFEFEQDGIKMFIDPISMMFLEGTTIDYELNSTSSGFKFDNPGASKTCGCGSSFK